MGHGSFDFDQHRETKVCKKSELLWTVRKSVTNQTPVYSRDVDLKFARNKPLCCSCGCDFCPTWWLSFDILKNHQKQVQQNSNIAHQLGSFQHFEACQSLFFQTRPYGLNQTPATKKPQSHKKQTGRGVIAGPLPRGVNQKYPPAAPTPHHPPPLQLPAFLTGAGGLRQKKVAGIQRDLSPVSFSVARRTWN